MNKVIVYSKEFHLKIIFVVCLFELFENVLEFHEGGANYADVLSGSWVVLPDVVVHGVVICEGHINILCELFD